MFTNINRLFFSFLFIAFSLYADYVPTPEMAISFDIKQDSREWVQKMMDGNAKGFVAELVPKGDSIKSWNELVAQQIFFTRQPLPEYVQLWKTCKGVSPVI